MAINAGLLNSIWTQAFETAQWFASQPYVSTSMTVQQAALVYSTMTAGANMVGALQLINSLDIYSNLLSAMQLLPVNFGSAALALATRQNAVDFLSFNLNSVLPTVSSGAASAALSQNLPALTTVDYVSALSGLQPEMYPLGITQNITDWQQIQSSLQAFYGFQLTSIYDSAAYSVSASIAQSGVLQNGAFTIGSSQYLYNQMYAIPTIFGIANLYTNSLYDITAQQAMVLQHALRAMARAVSLVLLAADAPSPQTQVFTTQVYGNESLQDVANRTLQDFEQWQAIGSLNQIPAGVLLSPGQALFIPPTSLPSGTTFSYNVNVLGRDINLGPTSGSMPTWTGDFSTISGPDNLIYALGRRLLTTLGTFIYDRSYGSRIPPEVGAVQAVGTLQHIAAYGVSCLQSDPRVSQVFNAGVCASTGGQGLVSFAATVQPIGPAQTAVQLNYVIGG